MGNRVESNEKEYYAALIKENIAEEEAKTEAKNTANTFSGMAFWPRLVLDTEGELVVDSRGPMGEPQKSHWQTVVSLMNPTPVPVQAGDKIRITESAELGQEVLSPVRYSLQGELFSGPP